MHIVRKIKKSLSVIMLIALVLTSLPVFAIQNATVKVSSPQVYKGNQCDVALTLDNVTELSGVQFILKYDQTKFDVSSTYTIADQLKERQDLAFPNDPLKTIPGLNLEAIVNSSTGEITVFGGKDINMMITSPIDVVVFKFTAKNDVDNGTYPLTFLKSKLVTVGIPQDKTSVRTIEPAITNGAITVISNNPGGGGHYTPPSTTPTPTPTPSSTVAPTPTPPAVVTVVVKPVVAEGKATSTVTEASATKAITDAIAAAKKDSTTSEVKINVAPTTEVVTTVETAIKENTMTELKSKAVDSVTIATQIVDVTFDKKAITVISENTKNDVSLSVEKVNTSTLSEEVQKEVGTRPVYDFSLTSNGKKISDFKDGLAKITIPYVLKDGEKASNIVVYYIQDDGTLKKMTNVKYDETLKAAVFYTNHFSKFAIAFEKHFTDVSGWSEEFIYYLANKGIINGKEEGIFAPEDNITRAEFVAIIARSVGMSKDQTSKADYTDVTEADWFAPYVTWAKEKGIVSGYEDGSFAPNKEITREELCTMIVRALTSNNVTIETADLTFADSNLTSDWAKASVATLAKLGIVSGKGDNKFAPLDNATRAESAKIITGMYKILNNIK